MREITLVENWQGEKKEEKLSGLKRKLKVSTMDAQIKRSGLKVSNSKVFSSGELILGHPVSTACTKKPFVQWTNSSSIFLIVQTFNETQQSLRGLQRRQTIALENQGVVLRIVQVRFYQIFSENFQDFKTELCSSLLLFNKNMFDFSTYFLLAKTLLKHSSSVTRPNFDPESKFMQKLTIAHHQV